MVINKFKGFSANEIIKFMHKEEAYRNTIDGEVISYKYAKMISMDI